MVEESSELDIINRDDDELETGRRVDTEGDDGDDNSEEARNLRGQIDETRQEIGETVDAIQEKLNISTISEQVKEQVSEQISNAVETAKDAVYDVTIGKVKNFMQQAGE